MSSSWLRIEISVLATLGMPWSIVITPWMRNSRIPSLVYDNVMSGFGLISAERGRPDMECNGVTGAKAWDGKAHEIVYMVWFGEFYISMGGIACKQAPTSERIRP
jgi:hypothetical protein